MHRTAATVLAPTNQEVEAVLATLAAGGTEVRLRLNDLAERTGLPTGHVGRHLRTLERDRLARYASGAWEPTQRGVRHAEDVAGLPVALAA